MVPLEIAKQIMAEACLGEEYARNGVIAALTESIAAALTAREGEQLEIICAQLAWAMEQRAALQARVTELEQALDPFAEMLCHYRGEESDHTSVLWCGRNPRLELSDLRRARAALPAKPGEDDDG